MEKFLNKAYILISLFGYINIGLSIYFCQKQYVLLLLSIFVFEFFISHFTSENLENIEKEMSINDIFIVCLILFSIILSINVSEIQFRLFLKLSWILFSFLSLCYVMICKIHDCDTAQ